jgi:integrase
LELEEGTATITRQFVIHPGTYEIEVRPTKRPRSKATISPHPETVAKLKRRKAEQAAHRLAMGEGWPGRRRHLPWPRLHVGRWAAHPARHPHRHHRPNVRGGGAAAAHPHGLRHSFATAALKARVPVEVVAARLGNTVRVVQETYAHVIPSDDEDAAQLVGDPYRQRTTGGSARRMVASDGEEDDTGRPETEAS